MGIHAELLRGPRSAYQMGAAFEWRWAGLFSHNRALARFPFLAPQANNVGRRGSNNTSTKLPSEQRRPQAHPSPSHARARTQLQLPLAWIASRD